jgi:peptidoglycan/xylan/chitin deacetylase (PgdA/CDA1 family)
MPRHLTIRTPVRPKPGQGILTPKARFVWLLTFLVLLPLGFGAYAARTPSSQVFGDIVTHGSGTDRVVALTFDDGPNEPYTGQILDVLKDEGVHATFFVIGMNAERQPETVRRIVREGNDLGNHSYAHRKRDTLLDLHYNDAAKTNAILAQITGIVPRLYRAPNGFHTPWSMRAVGSRGLRVIGWDVESNDWDEPGTDTIVRRTMQRVHPGAIILLHDGDNTRQKTDRGQQVAATRMLIDTLKGQGYRFVTVSEMLGLPPLKGNG